QQRPPGVLPEAGPEVGGRLQGGAQQRLDLLGRNQVEQLAQIAVVGDQQGDAVVVVKGLQRVAVLLLPGGAQGEGEGAVHAVAPKCVQDDLPGVVARARIVV